MSSQLLDTGLAVLNFARTITASLLDAIPEEASTHMPFGAGNHALWIAAHITWEDDDFLNSFIEGRKTSLPKSWHDACGQGSIPVAQVDKYPTMAEARSQMTALRQECIAFFSSRTDEQLMQPVPKEWQKFAPTLAAMMGAIGCHESIHAGQLTVIRKSLSMKPVFG